MCHPSPERRVRVALSCPGAYVARGRGSAYVVAARPTQDRTPAWWPCHGSLAQWSHVDNGYWRWTQWRIQGGFLVARNPPPPTMICFNQGVTPLLAPTLTSHFHLRRSETPLETNSGYATGTGMKMVANIRCRGTGMLKKENQLIGPVSFIDTDRKLKSGYIEFAMARR